MAKPRPAGDHGTGIQAIEFALEIDDHYDMRYFLQGWNEGSLDEWPEYYEWLEHVEEGGSRSPGSFMKS
jgi:hypothetical protein